MVLCSFTFIILLYFFGGVRLQKSCVTLTFKLLNKNVALMFTPFHLCSQFSFYTPNYYPLLFIQLRFTTHNIRTSLLQLQYFQLTEPKQTIGRGWIKTSSPHHILNNKLSTTQEGNSRAYIGKLIREQKTGVQTQEVTTDNRRRH